MGPTDKEQITNRDGATEIITRRIGELDEKTLKEILKVMLKPEEYVFLSLTETKKKDLRKEEKKIGKILMNCISDLHRKESIETKKVLITKAFSPNESEIQKILEKSKFIHRIGLRKRMDILGESGITQSFFRGFRISIDDSGNLVYNRNPISEGDAYCCH